MTEPAFDFSTLQATSEPAEDFAPDPSKSQYEAAPADTVTDAPKRGRGRKTGTRTRTRTVDPDKPKVVIPNRRGQFIEPLTQLYTTIGLGLYVKDQTCAQAIIENAPKCAESLDDWAYRNKAVRQALYSLTKITDFGAVFAAHMPILLAIAMHHVPQLSGSLGAFTQPATPHDGEPHTETTPGAAA